MSIQSILYKRLFTTNIFEK